MKTKTIKPNKIKAKNNTSWKVSNHSDLNSHETEAIFKLISTWINNTNTLDLSHYNEKTLWKYIDSHGLGGIAGNLCTNNKLKSDYINKKANHRYISNIFHTNKALEVCKKIYNHANLVNASIFFMKGPALSKNVYNDAGIRSFSDIDIFAKSYNDIIAIINSLQGKITKQPSKFRVIHNLRNAIKIHTKIDGWDIEFMYLINNPSDPMYNLLLDHQNQFFNKSNDLNKALNPYLEAHLIFLILHMSINHYCSRLIWFVDIVIFIKKYNNILNFDKFFSYLKNINMINITSIIFEFCNEHFNVKLPIVEPANMKWNYKFLKKIIISDMVINSKLAHQYQNKFKIFFMILFKIGTFYYFSDIHKGNYFKSLPAKWTTARFLNPLKIKNKIFTNFFEFLVSILLYPMSYILAKIYIKHKNL